ncbi:MAG TPA: PEP-CTERM sorting domain-containing protein [Planctomycetaceae bacterium]
MSNSNMNIVNKLFHRSAGASRRQAPAACLLAIAALLGSTQQGVADIIVGPSPINLTGGGDSDWGIQFHVLQESTLTGFDFNQHPFNTDGTNSFTGTITVYDVTNPSTPTSVFTVGYGSPSGTPNVISFTGLNVALQAGDNYQLVATSNSLFGTNNEAFAYVPAGTYPDSNSDISVTSGVYSGNTTGFSGTRQWYAFSNITTATVTPEPGSLLLLSTGLATIGGFGWLKKRKTKIVDAA